MAVNPVQGGNPLESIHAFDGGGSGAIIQSAVLVKEGTDTPLRSHATRGLVVDLSGTVIATGIQTIATAGAPTQLNGGISFGCKSIFVCALQANTQQVAIGDSVVNAASGSLRGIPLQPGQGISLDIDDASKIYVDVLGDGHGVTYATLS